MKNIFVTYNLFGVNSLGYRVLEEEIRKNFPGLTYKSIEQTGWFIKGISAKVVKDRVYTIILTTLGQVAPVTAIDVAQIATSYNDPELDKFLKWIPRPFGFGGLFNLPANTVFPTISNKTTRK